MTQYCIFEDTQDPNIKKCKQCGKVHNKLVMALRKTKCCATTLTSKIKEPEYTIAPSNGTCLGISNPRPSNYGVTVVIPVLETVDQLKVCVEVLQAQTIKPYILIIDTGSVQNLDKIEQLRCKNVEIHYVRSHGWQHPSQPVAVAQDLGTSLCRTEYVFYTHADCFLMRKTVLEDWLNFAKIHKIVGYQISPRTYKGWESEYGHTALMVHLPTILENKINWSMSEYAYARKTTLKPSLFGPNCPDTESNFNEGLKSAGIKGLMLGGEENLKRNINFDFDHPRSFCCSSIYDNKYHKTIALEMEKAMAEARIRVQKWQN